MSRRTLLAALALSCLGALHARADEAPSRTAVTDLGLVGDFYAPVHPAGRLAAVIVLGGTEGGLGESAARDAQDIAAHGFAVLQLAYFGVGSLPKEPTLLPLEYFKIAIDWLRAQPSVDGARIGIEGTSLGSEVALVVAAHYPDIRAVVAGAPSSVVWPGIRRTSTNLSSTFSLSGKPFPYLPFGAPGGSIYSLYADGLKGSASHPEAGIAVEKINGPVMLICGKDDTLWPSCEMAEQVTARLRDWRFRYTHELLEYEDAGHRVFGRPVDPGSADLARLGILGGDPEGNNAARHDNWPRTLQFLDSALRAGLTPGSP
jgi:uncharacterized protein